MQFIHNIEECCKTVYSALNHLHYKNLAPMTYTRMLKRLVDLLVYNNKSNFNFCNLL